MGDGIMGIYSGFGLLTKGLYENWLDLRIVVGTNSHKIKVKRREHQWLAVAGSISRWMEGLEST